MAWSELFKGGSVKRGNEPDVVKVLRHSKDYVHASGPKLSSCKNE